MIIKSIVEVTIDIEKQEKRIKNAIQHVRAFHRVNFGLLAFITLLALVCDSFLSVPMLVQVCLFFATFAFLKWYKKSEISEASQKIKQFKKECFILKTA